MNIVDRTDNLEIDFVDDMRNKFNNSTIYLPPLYK
jgi:hypothetical protein